MPHKISIDEARALGLKRYFTGKPCTRGHVAERYTRGSRCVQCVRATPPTGHLSKERDEARALGLDRYLIGTPCKRGHVAERYTSNGICVECGTEHARAKLQRMTPEQMAELRHRTRVQQANKYDHMPPPHECDCPPRPEDGRCECCGEFVGKDNLKLDHDHALLGDFLGWCCHACNRAGDDIARLEARIRAGDTVARCKARVEYLEVRGFTSQLDRES